MHYRRANLYSFLCESLSIMAPPTPPEDDGRDVPPLSDEVLIEVLEGIREPALLHLPGGRIAAVNRAAARLTDLKPVGMTISELLGRYETRRANGTPLRMGDLPYNRALRGEIVGQGERIEMTLPDGTIYRALVTSTPIIVDGKVVAALSVWRDFNAYIRGLALPPEPPSDPAGGDETSAQ